MSVIVTDRKGRNRKRGFTGRRGGGGGGGGEVQEETYRRFCVFPKEEGVKGGTFD